MSCLLLTRQELVGLVSMTEAAQAMKQAFRALSLGEASAPPRTHVDVSAVGGKTLLMGATVPGLGLATKVVSFFPRNREQGKKAVTGLILALEPTTGEPIALCDGTYLTELRTGAGTCAATDLLARSDSRVAALIGTGGQAEGQLQAMLAARPLDEVRIFGRSEGRAAELVRDFSGRTSARLFVAKTSAEAIDGADIVTASTSSSTPVFDGQRLKRGAHINAIGSITAQMEEVDQHTVASARIFVDSVSGALEEAGELIQGAARGLTTSSEWTELGAVAADQQRGRQHTDELTFYKSVGHAVQDVAIAHLVVQKARERGLGTLLEL